MPALASLNPNIVGTLARTAGLLADEAQRTEEADAATLRQLLVEPTAAERIVLDLLRWQQQPLAARRGVLRLALNQLVPHARQIGYEHIDRILQIRRPGKSSGPHPLPEGLAWTVVGATAVQAARLCLHAASATPLAVDHPFLDAAWRAEHTECPVPMPGELAIGAWRLITTRLSTAELPAAWPTSHSPWKLYANAEALRQPALTTPRPGQRIAPFGMDGGHRRVVDVLSSHKIPPSVRPGWPLLVDRRDGRVLWVCGLCSAESLRIYAQTRDVICCEWQIR